MKWMGGPTGGRLKTGIVWGGRTECPVTRRSAGGGQESYRLEGEGRSGGDVLLLGLMTGSPLKGSGCEIKVCTLFYLLWTRRLSRMDIKIKPYLNHLVVQDSALHKS